jgi:hypothetical protein
LHYLTKQKLYYAFVLDISDFNDSSQLSGKSPLLSPQVSNINYLNYKGNKKLLVMSSVLVCINLNLSSVVTKVTSYNYNMRGGSSLRDTKLFVCPLRAIALLCLRSAPLPFLFSNSKVYHILK